MEDLKKILKSWINNYELDYDDYAYMESFKHHDSTRDVEDAYDEYDEEEEYECKREHVIDDIKDGCLSDELVNYLVEVVEKL